MSDSRRPPDDLIYLGVVLAVLLVYALIDRSPNYAEAARLWSAALAAAWHAVAGGG